MNDARRSHARSGGHIGDGGDLEGIALPVAQQRLAKDRVPDLGDVVDFLGFGVLHPVALLEGGVDEHVDVLVDRPCDEEPAELPVVRGEVRPATPRGRRSGARL